MPVAIAFCVVHLVLISFVSTWWGGHCWGPRYLTEMMPFLTLLLVPALDSVMAGAWKRRLFVCLVLYSASLQFIGAFCYPRGFWDDTPISADLHSERFWDWSDNPINRTIRGGVNLTAHAILFEGAIHGKAAALRKIRETGATGYRPKK